MTPYDANLVREAQQAIDDGRILDARMILDGLLALDETGERSYRAVRLDAPAPQYRGAKGNTREYATLGRVGQFVKAHPDDEFEVYEGETLWRALTPKEVDDLRAKKRR